MGNYRYNPLSHYNIIFTVLPMVPAWNTFFFFFFNFFFILLLLYNEWSKWWETGGRQLWCPWFVLYAFSCMSLSNTCFSTMKNVEAEAHLLNWANTVSTQNKASDRGKWPLLKHLLLGFQNVALLPLIQSVLVEYLFR